MILTLLLLLITACTSKTETPFDTGFIRTSLIFSVNGKTLQGSGLVDRQTSYKVVVNLPVKMHSVTVRTCHREPFLFLNPQTPFTYNYVPVWEIETHSSCLFTVMAIDTQGNRHYGVFDTTANENGKAKVYCNGEVYVAEKGASFCESNGQAELIQMLRFDSMTEVYAPERCNQPYTTDKIYYKYRISPGYCVYLFKSKDGTTHRHTTRGYTELPVYLQR